VGVTLVEALQARETAEENSQGLSDVVAYVKRRWEESERECWNWVEELTVVQT
jgi:hypothetical protein